VNRFFFYPVCSRDRDERQGRRNVSYVLIAEQRFECFDKSREGFFVVSDNSVVGFLEDVGFRVFIDGHDRLGMGTSGHVLGSAGESDGDIEIGADD